jgi:hypothetical protein
LLERARHGTDDATPATLAKLDYCQLRGLTPRRLAQLIKRGLPVRDDELVDVAAADAWRDANLRRYRRREGEPRPGPAAGKGRARDLGRNAVAATLREHGHDVHGPLQFHDVRLAEQALKVAERRQRLRRERAELIDRARTLHAIFAYSREDRDSALLLPAKWAPIMAAKLGVEAAAVRALLEDMVQAWFEERAKHRFSLAATAKAVPDDDEPEGDEE